MTSAASTPIYAPYGWMPPAFHATLPPPKGFDGDAPAWAAWMDETADLFKAFLWPRWQGGAWVGDLAAADELTRADLAAMPALAKLMDEPVRAASPVRHELLFRAEDLAAPSLGTFKDHLPAPPPALLRGFDRWVMEAGSLRAQQAAIGLKVHMQRPRPYQMALQLLPAVPFAYHVAITAVTPSLVSGHALQGAMALVTVVLHLEHELRAPTPPALLRELQRYFLHVGDRRTFAGVHYPSDNLSSWFTVLRLLRRMSFNDPDPKAERTRGRQVLWEGIQAESPVYQAMAAAGGAFNVPLARLKAEAEASL